VTTPPTLDIPQPAVVPSIFAGLLGRPLLMCLAAGLLAITLRLSLLPVIPIPTPRIHDEFSYLLGADTFADGRITNPPHPMWVHFETFHVNMQPTYCSKYFPAQSLSLAFGQKFLGHPWFGVCLDMGLMFAAICWMLQGWTAPKFALATTLLALASWGLTTYWINSYWGGAIPALGGLLVIGAVPRLAQKITAGPSLMAAIGSAVLANSRPFEGALTVISSTAVFLWWRHRERQPWRSVFDRRLFGPFALVLLPVVAAMAYYNYRTTGSPMVPPYVVHERIYAASPRFYLQAPVAVPVYRHEIIRQLWEWDRSMYLAARRNPLNPIMVGASSAVPLFLMNLLAPAALAGLLWGNRTRVIAALAILSLPIAGLLMEKAFEAHYLAPMCGAFLILAAEGLKGVAQQVRAPSAPIILAGIVLGLSISQVASAARGPAGWPNGIYSRPRLIEQLQQKGGHHLVLVRYGPHHNLFEEWVYNRADIDRSDIVWARDMGDEKNRELVDYYNYRTTWVLEPDVEPIALRPYRPADAALPRASR